MAEHPLPEVGGGGGRGAGSGTHPNSAHPQPSSRRAPLPILGPLLSPFYRLAINHINRRFDSGRKVHRLPIPVISIGNLSVGGTGKTPMVVHAVSTLLEHGRRPVIAMRGYAKGKSIASDETDLYARTFPDLPIVAQPDRTAGLRTLLASSSNPPNCVVLDDGFQHRQLARDLDIVLIDAAPDRSPFTDRLLPAGYLREPVESLKRAHAVVLTHAELADEHHLARLSTQIQATTGREPIAITRHAWLGLLHTDQPLPLDHLIGKRIVGCCAIGHPEGFLRSLRRTVGDNGRVESLILPDHDPFHPTTLRRLADLARAHRADAIVITDKDWSKLRHIPAATFPCPLLRPQLAIAFDSGRQTLESLLLQTVP